MNLNKENYPIDQEGILKENRIKKVDNILEKESANQEVSPKEEELYQKIAGLEEQNKKLEEENEKKKEQLKMAEQKFEKAPVAFHIIDKTGKIQEVNEYWLKSMGYTKEEVIGKEIFDFIAEDQRENARERFQKRLEGIKEENLLKKEFPRQYIAKDGKIIYGETTNTIFRDEKDKVTGVQTYFRDITESVHEHEKFLAEQKRHLKALENLLSEVAHEIRNPLTVLGGFARRLYKKLSKESKEGAYAETVVQEANRMEKMLKSLTAMLTVIKEKVRLEDAQLEDEVEKTIKKFKEDNKDDAVKFDIEVDEKNENNLKVKLDKEKFNFALREILKTFKESNIEQVDLDLNISQQGVVIEIKGESNGMIIKDLDLKGDNYFKSIETQGTGARLAFAAEIMKRHQGELGVSLSEDRKSLEISIKLPLGKAD